MSGENESCQKTYKYRLLSDSMEELLRKILLVNVVFLVLFALFLVTEQIGEVDPSGVFDLSDLIGAILFYGAPLFVVLVSVIYQHHHMDFGGYGKSLFLPLSYILFSAVLVFTWTFVFLSQGEGRGFTIIFYLMQLGATFAAVLIVNLIYLIIGKSMKQDSNH